MNSFPETRVVVTGWGCVSALGFDTESTWRRLLNGDNARAPIRSFPVEGCRVTEGAEAHLPSIPWLSEKALGRLSRGSRMALPAAREALLHAGLLDANGHSKLPRLETSISTTAAGMERIESFVKQVWKAPTHKNQAARVATYQAQQQINDIQKHLVFTGPTSIVSNACAGGANAIGHAADLIRSGFTDVCLAGGYDPLCELVFCGFDSLQSLAPEQCRPFDQNRDGLMLGEGAGFIVLENATHALGRGAQIRGVLAGYGHSTDLFHLTQPSVDGAPMARAIRNALHQAHLQPEDIGYLNAHGTGTPFNDRAEAAAFRDVFGESLASLRLGSTKSATGHTLGAAGSIEAIFCLNALNCREIPPQINTLNPEPWVAGVLASKGDLLSKPAVLSVNLGFGGSNAALIFTAA